MTNSRARTRGQTTGTQAPVNKAPRLGKSLARASSQLPQEPAISLPRDVLEGAASELYGFRIRETWERMRELRSKLRATPQARGLRLKRLVVEELTHQADVALDLTARFRLADERWSQAIIDGLALLDAFEKNCGSAARVRIRELHIDANHSTPSARASFNKSAARLEAIIERSTALRTALTELASDLPPRGRSLARWQALLRAAGFTWKEIAPLFAGTDMTTPEAARKRVARLHQDPEEKRRTATWLADLEREEADK